MVFKTPQCLTCWTLLFSALPLHGHSELLKTLGVDSLIVDDLYSLDTESLEHYKPIHAFIFLFKWVGGSDETGGASGAYDHDFPGFFANQVCTYLL